MNPSIPAVRICGRPYSPLSAKSLEAAICAANRIRLMMSVSRARRRICRLTCSLACAASSETAATVWSGVCCARPSRAAAEVPSAAASGSISPRSGKFRPVSLS